jgi:hypothetical protein
MSTTGKYTGYICKGSKKKKRRERKNCWSAAALWLRF